MKKLVAKMICSAVFLTIALAAAGQNTVIPTLRLKQQFCHSEAWKKLDSYPYKGGRNDDVCFISAEKGWAVNHDGYLYATRDGGKNWQLQLTDTASYFRALAFKDSLNGWLGTVGVGIHDHVTDTVALYRTKDGGGSWKPVVFNGPYPAGICGLQVVSERMIVGSGRVVGPSFFVRSLDGGRTWKSWDMNQMAGSLITPHFLDEQNGFLIGGTTDSKNSKESRALVLSTKDGGESWDTVYVSGQKGEWCWKISFPTKEIGYISVQRNVHNGKYYFLKTIDGGKTWQEKEFTKSYYYAQGIGFINKDIGWIGGARKQQHAYETRDGGETWYPIDKVIRVNKFTFINGTTGYAGGMHVYKLSGPEPLPNGTVRYYHQNGRIVSIRNYTNGILNGKSTDYHPDGRIKCQGIYENNLKTGIWLYQTLDGGKQRIKYRHDIARLSKSSLKAYTGIYEENKVGGKRHVHVILKNGELSYKWVNFSGYRVIYPEKFHHFFSEDDYRIKLTFNRVDGKVVDLAITDRPGVTNLLKKLGEKEATRLYRKYGIKVK